MYDILFFYRIIYEIFWLYYFFIFFTILYIYCISITYIKKNDKILILYNLICINIYAKIYF